MARLGNKSEARKLAKDLGIPVVEGSDGPVEDAESAATIAARIGYPVLIKAVSGGGGKVWHIKSEEELLDYSNLTPRGQVNSKLTGLYRKYIENPRHIEVQVIAGNGNTVHLGRRDCSSTP